MKKERIFQVSALLSAISIPLLSVIANDSTLGQSLTLIRLLAMSGSLFAVAAFFSYSDIIELEKLPKKTVEKALRFLISYEGALLFGLLLLVIFQIIQSYTLWWLD